METSARSDNLIFVFGSKLSKPQRSAVQSGTLTAVGGVFAEANQLIG